MTANPYSPPQTDSEERAPESVDAARLELMATGQKMIIRAIILYFCAIGLSSATRSYSPIVMGLVFLVAMAAIVILSLVGVLRLSSGLGIPMPFRILLGVLIFVPLLNILFLAILSNQATRALRKAGYKVGLFGAKKPA